MAKKNSPSIQDKVTVVLTEPYRIFVKFAPKTLVPACAIDHRWLTLTTRTQSDFMVVKNAKFVTNDNKFVKMDIISAMNNFDGCLDERLEDFCQKHFCKPFAYVESIWRSRFPKMDTYWFIVELSDYGM